MQFIKSHWISILIIGGLAVALWMQYNKTKKLEASNKAVGAAGFMDTNDIDPGYPGSGINPDGVLSTM